MTNERFDQILQRALAPEIDDSEIIVQKKKARFDDMKAIYKITAVAACAALIVGAGIGGNAYLHSRTGDTVNTDTVSNPPALDSASKAENSFVLKVNAEELEPNKSVPLTFKNGTSSSFSTGSEHEGVSYRIVPNFNCVGENIETINYSVNKGMFVVSEVRDGGSSLIRSGTECDTDRDYPGHQPGSFNQYDESQIVTKYFSEYTIGYDSQNSSKLCTAIYGWVGDAETEEKAFNWDYTPEQQAEAWKEIMESVEITCTVHYTDGTSASETIVVDCQAMAIKDAWEELAPDADPEAKIVVFSFKLK